jgi:hypothetical protein
MFDQKLFHLLGNVIVDFWIFKTNPASMRTTTPPPVSKMAGKS